MSTSAYTPMNIRFWLRRAKKAGYPGVVYCTLTTDGVQATPFSTGIEAWPPTETGEKPTLRSWQNAPVQRLYGTTPDVEADNDTLNALHHKLRAIRTDLDSKGKPTDARAVAEALRGYGKAVPCLVEAVDLFLAERAKKIRPDNAPEWDKSGYSKATVKKYRSRFGLLTEYLKKQQVPYMPLAKFTARHADALVSMITTRKAAPGKHAGRSRGQGGAQYAAKVVGLVSQVLDYAVNQEWLAVNPLASWATPHGFDKPLIYLLPEQVAQLEGYRFASDYLQRVVDSFLFSCWTGLAWSDYDNLDVNKHLSEGWLSMLRTKTGTSFSLPLLPGAERLLIKYGAEGLPRYENAPLNRALKEIAAVLGWPLELQQELSHHAARRTFGMFLLNEDVPLATVSAVLGHRNQRTTERYYAKFIEKRKVERDFAGLRERLSNRPSPAPVQSSALPTRPQPARFQPRVVPVVPLWAEPATPARKEVASA